MILQTTVSDVKESLIASAVGSWLARIPFLAIAALDTPRAYVLTFLAHLRGSAASTPRRPTADAR